MNARPTHSEMTALAVVLQPYYKISENGREVLFACRHCTKVWGLARTDPPTHSSLLLLIQHIHHQRDLA